MRSAWTINGQPPRGVKDAGGRFLGASATGAPGSNPVRAFGAPARLPKPRKPLKKPKSTEIAASKLHARHVDALVAHAAKTGSSIR